jgi:hypothetical protein
VNDPDLENGSCKTELALGANYNSVWRARHDCCSRNELDGDPRYAADFLGMLAAQLSNMLRHNTMRRFASMTGWEEEREF